MCININLILINLLSCRNVFKFCHYFVCILLLLSVLFQAWGDYASMSQAVVIYVAFACDVLLICWFGTQLTQHVRVNGLLFFFLLFLLFFLLQRHAQNVVNIQQIRFSFTYGKFSVFSGLLFSK